MLDNVKLDGAISVRRQYENVTGNVLFDSVTVPFPETMLVRSLTLAHVPQAENGELWQLSMELDAQRLGIALDQVLQLDVTAQNTEEAVWTGSLLALLPGSDDPEALNYEDQIIFSCTYNLNIPQPEDIADVYQSRYEHKAEATLVVKPDETMNLPAFSLAGNYRIYSNSNTPSTICHVEGALALTDLDQESAVSLSFSGRTTRRWTPTMLTDALASSLRLDMMSASSRQDLLKQLWSDFIQALGARMIK